MDDLISRQQAIDALYNVDEYNQRSVTAIKNLPSIQPDTTTHDSIPVKTGKNDGVGTSGDCISRQQAIMAIEQHRIAVLEGHKWDEGIEYGYAAAHRHIVDIVEQLPSAQPERTCVNCGRTANNGGWYADGGTRCPIEEHYALPKDGYCHLWEKRNVTDDDYPERREDERPES